MTPSMAALIAAGSRLFFGQIASGDQRPEIGACSDDTPPAEQQAVNALVEAFGRADLTANPDPKTLVRHASVACRSQEAGSLFPRS